MFTPKLHIPAQEVVYNTYQGIRPDKVSVQNWLNNRDPSNRREFLDTLYKLNRIRCSPEERMAIMTILAVEIERERDELSRETSLITFPINEQYQNLINNLQQLLLESSVAWQIIIHDILQQQEYLDQYMGNLLPESVYHALSYLSGLLVERFEFYLSEPKGIWQELNQLYLLAEMIGAGDITMTQHCSMKHCYLQIAVLKIINPYRLMRFEARKLYKLLVNWVQYCTIDDSLRQASKHTFIVDLLADEAPHYSEEQQTSAIPQSEYRSIDISGLSEFLSMNLAKISQQKYQQVVSQQSRMHNEMLKRIDLEMSLHQKRSEERQLTGNEIKLVSGFTACHYFISQRKAFLPQAEINARREKRLEEIRFNEDSDIHLIGLLEEAQLLNKKNPLGELQSINPFIAEQHSSDSALSLQEQLNPEWQEESWKQKNESSHGMLLVSNNDIDMPIGVGMLVAYRLNVERAYCLAMVKWLRINPHKGIAIGVQLIAVQARAVAVKDAENGGQYQRAFLITENDTHSEGGKLHIIVPAGSYDVGCTLTLWHNQKLNYITINRLLLATDSFERFAFAVA